MMQSQRCLLKESVISKYRLVPRCTLYAATCVRNRYFCFFVYSFVYLFIYYSFKIFVCVVMCAFVYLLQFKYLVTIEMFFLFSFPAWPSRSERDQLLIFLSGCALLYLQLLYSFFCIKSTIKVFVIVCYCCSLTNAPLR